MVHVVSWFWPIFDFLQPASSENCTWITVGFVPYSHLAAWCHYSDRSCLRWGYKTKSFFLLSFAAHALLPFVHHVNSRDITCTDVIAILWVKFCLSGTQRCTRLQDVAATRTATCVLMWSQVPAHTDSSAHLASFKEHSFDNAVLNTFSQNVYAGKSVRFRTWFRICFRYAFKYR